MPAGERIGTFSAGPTGIPIAMPMIFEGLVKRMPREMVAAGTAKSIAEKFADRTEYGECQEKCPYGLPIIETVRRSGESAQELVNQHAP